MPLLTMFVCSLLLATTFSWLLYCKKWSNELLLYYSFLASHTGYYPCTGNGFLLKTVVFDFSIWFHHLLLLFVLKKYWLHFWALERSAFTFLVNRFRSFCTFNIIHIIESYQQLLAFWIVETKRMKRWQNFFALKYSHLRRSISSLKLWFFWVHWNEAKLNYSPLSFVNFILCLSSSIQMIRNNFFKFVELKVSLSLILYFHFFTKRHLFYTANLCFCSANYFTFSISDCFFNIVVLEVRG